MQDFMLQQNDKMRRDEFKQALKSKIFQITKQAYEVLNFLKSRIAQIERQKETKEELQLKRQ
ncbi:hypothetical protein pb186bvf_007795 [Paramecium bursaria]